MVRLVSWAAGACVAVMGHGPVPSAKDRSATMMAAPVMTCSARLPVCVLLIGILVAPSAKVGPFGAQGVVMFGLYLLGSVSFAIVVSREHQDMIYAPVPEPETYSLLLGGLAAIGFVARRRRT